MIVPFVSDGGSVVLQKEGYISVKSSNSGGTLAITKDVIEISNYTKIHVTYKPVSEQANKFIITVGSASIQEQNLTIGEVYTSVMNLINDGKCSFSAGQYSKEYYIFQVYLSR